MMTDEQWLGQFRFARDDLERLRLGLGIPFTMVGPVRLRWGGDDGLCIPLRRSAYPSRLSDLAEILDRPRSVISIIFNCTAEFVYNRWGFLLRDINEAPWISANCLQSFSQATVNRGAPYANLFGFVDGTIRPIYVVHLMTNVTFIVATSAFMA